MFLHAKTWAGLSPHHVQVVEMSRNLCAAWHTPEIGNRCEHPGGLRVLGNAFIQPSPLPVQSPSSGQAEKKYYQRHKQEWECQTLFNPGCINTLGSTKTTFHHDKKDGTAQITGRQCYLGWRET